MDNTGYNHQPSKDFASACNEGNIEAVKEGLEDLEINVNWYQDSPMLYAVLNEHVDVIKLLLASPRVKNDYENRKEIFGDDNYKGQPIKMVYNPFSNAMLLKNYEIMDLLITVGKVNILRVKYLDILIQMKEEEMNLYFMKMETGCRELI